MAAATPLQLFIGFDPREELAWHVFVHSLRVNSSAPLAITALALSQLGQVLTRPRDPLQSTDFAFSRFLTPWLCDYAGWSLFMDCDMLALDDIARLWALRDERYAVQVVKHAHHPRESSKFLAQPQTAYARKNWSSVMLFNNARCRALTPALVNSASGLHLHQFQWLPDDELIGALPARWNSLVGYDSAALDDISILHFTTGGPWFEAYRDVPHAELWFRCRDAMLSGTLAGRQQS